MMWGGRSCGLRTAPGRRDRNMPRFFFHFHDGIIEESDDEGIVLATRAVAATQGRRAVLMIIGEDEGAFDWSRWLLTILHEDGSCVLRLPFQSVIEDLKTSFQ